MRKKTLAPDTSALIDAVGASLGMSGEATKEIKELQASLVDGSPIAEEEKPAILTLALGLWALDVFGDEGDESTWVFKYKHNQNMSIESAYRGRRVLGRDQFISMQPLGDTGVPLASGLNCIFGPGGTGKTPVLEGMFALMREASTIVHYGEPVPWYTTELRVALKQIALSFLAGKHVFFDSTKNLVFRTPGNATTGGIAGTLYAQLSDLGTIFSAQNLAFVTVLNVSTSKTETLDIVNEAVRSNTNMLIFASPEKPGVYAYSLRDYMRDERTSGTFVSGKQQPIKATGRIVVGDDNAVTVAPAELHLDTVSVRESVMAHFIKYQTRPV